MDNILVLGAGIYQIPLIKSAVERGLRVFAASWSASDPGMRYAHDCWIVDTRDYLELCRRARAHGITGVVTAGTDVAVPALGYICDSLGLPGVSWAGARAAADKGLMQKLFKQHKVASATSIAVTDLDGARQAVASLGLPVMVKAPDSSGSRGISKVDGPDGLAAALAAAFSVAKTDYVLVESYLTGIEFGAQAIVLDGVVEKIICHNDTVTAPPISVPIGHSCPLSLPAEVVSQAANVCQRAATALALANAVCNADLIYDGDRVYVLEFGARVGATGIPEIIDLCYGLNLYDVALDIALGRMPRLESRYRQAAAGHLLCAKDSGELKRIGLNPGWQPPSGLVGVRFDVKAGDQVSAFKTGPDRIGDLLSVADTVDAAEAVCRQALAEVQIEIV